MTPRGLARGILFLLTLALFPGPGGALAGDAFVADLVIHELGTPSSFRLRVFHDPDLVHLGGLSGHMFIVKADSSWGADAFLLPSDLAFEVGETQIYRVEFEQSSDLLGQALGGRLRGGEEHLGFVITPSALRVGDYFPDHPDSVVVRYAHHRASFRRATEAERDEWRRSMDRAALTASLNTWWDWIQLINHAPPMPEGEARLFAERLFPGQGDALLESGINPDALRNAILRVGQRRLIDTPVTQRVAPAYPAAARQSGAQGLVVVLAYVSERGTVEDALVLASNTVHLLNYAAVSAALDWRFVPARNENRMVTDGWRILPFQFGLESRASGESVGPAGFVPPRMLKVPELEYPEKAFRARLEGTVVYQVVINREGRLVQATLVESVHPLLDDAALRALEATLFAPATRDGQALEAELLVPFRFPPEPAK